MGLLTCSGMRYLSPIFLSLALLGSSACSASLIEMPDHGRGLVGYSMGGLPPLVSARHDDAVAKMEQACHGPYSVVSEETEDEGAITVSSPNEENSYPQEYTYVTFTCVAGAVTASAR